MKQLHRPTLILTPSSIRQFNQRNTWIFLTKMTPSTTNTFGGNRSTSQQAYLYMHFLNLPQNLFKSCVILTGRITTTMRWQTLRFVSFVSSSINRVLMFNGITTSTRGMTEVTIATNLIVSKYVTCILSSYTGGMVHELIYMICFMC